MIVSDARRAANRRNASRSTGPKTDEGKEVARRNALKHGLTSSVVHVAEDRDLADRAAGLDQTFQPRNPWQSWLVTGIALLTVQLDRLGRIEQKVRAGACWRAIDFWDDDQRDEVERVAARLARDPVRVVGTLRRSPHGCDWLIERWAMLANIADRQSWTEEQRNLANNLLGTPLVLQGDAPGHTVDADGQTVAIDPSEATLARRLLAESRAQRDRVIEADEVARNLALADLDEFGNRDLVRLRRYERTLRSRLLEYYAMLQHEPPHQAGSTPPPGALLAGPPTPADPPPPTETNPPARQEASPITLPPPPAAPANEAIPAAAVAETKPLPAPTPPAAAVTPASRPEPVAAPAVAWPSVEDKVWLRAVLGRDGLDDRAASRPRPDLDKLRLRDRRHEARVR